MFARDSARADASSFARPNRPDLALIDGKTVRINVSAKAIHMGLITKPLKRDYKPETAK